MISIGKAPGISGGAILGDGRIALIIDVAGLINAALFARH
jgi:chemotaxis protein histidine kinase CheA